MPAFNFQPRFAADVEAGVKRQTVRAHRKRDPQPGQTAYLFTGMRRAECRPLGAHAITAVQHILVDTEGVIWLGDAPDALYPVLDDADAFAQADGFAGAAELVGWIARTHGLPFEGTVTYW